MQDYPVAGQTRPYAGCASASEHRALLVNDAPEVRELARLSLEHTGWSVQTVADGPAALDLLPLDEVPFEAVVLDVVMPRMDGPAVLSEMRAAGVPEPVPVVFLTATTRRADHHCLLALGAAGVIAKPFDPLALPRMLQLVLDEVRPEQERRPAGRRVIRRRRASGGRLGELTR